MSMIAAMDYTDDAHTVHVRLTRSPNFSIDVPDDHQASFALLEQLPKCQLLLFALAHHERHTRHGRLHALPSFAGTTYVVFITIFLDRIRPFDSFKSDTESHKRNTRSIIFCCFHHVR